MRKNYGITIGIFAAIAAILLTFTAAPAFASNSEETHDGVSYLWEKNWNGGYDVATRWISPDGRGWRLQVVTHAGTKPAADHPCWAYLATLNAAGAPSYSPKKAWEVDANTERKWGNGISSLPPSTAKPAPPPTPAVVTSGAEPVSPTVTTAPKTTAPGQAGDLQAAIQAGVKAELDRRSAAARAAQAEKNRWCGKLAQLGYACDEAGITAFQQRMAALGFVEGHEVDGVMGPQTKGLIKRALKAREDAALLSSFGAKPAATPASAPTPAAKPVTVTVTGSGLNTQADPSGNTVTVTGTGMTVKPATPAPAAPATKP